MLILRHSDIEKATIRDNEDIHPTSYEPDMASSFAAHEWSYEDLLIFGWVDRLWGEEGYMLD
jgi:hypothetical protein